MAGEHTDGRRYHAPTKPEPMDLLQTSSVSSGTTDDGRAQAGGVAITTPLPLSVAKGGREILALRCIEALQRLGVRAFPLDHWDPVRRYALIHCFGSEGSMWEIASRARASGVKVVVSPILVTGRSTLSLRAWARVDWSVPMRTSFRFRRDLVRLADAVIAQTETERRVLVSAFGVSSQRCHVIPNGVDEVFRNPSRDGYPRDRFIFCVGTIEARKGQLDVLRAARRAEKTVVFTGAIRHDDPYSAEFEREIAGAPGVVYDTQLEAGSAALAAAYASADALVLMSRAEGLPLVALEAQAAGCPLILSDLPQHREAFPEAVFVRLGDEAGLTAAIAAASELRSTRPAVQPPWGWEQVASAVRRVYAAVAPEVVAA
jgi:glycosyltransferase involved in cell wall biosynthesis